jgi:chromate transporter
VFVLSSPAPSGFDARMPADTPPPPRLVAIVAVFAAIGLQSWGGGLSAWIRREVVVRRGWMDERSFLVGLTLCQIAPGPNGINLAVLIGTALRGGPGALAALLGMVGLPAVLVLALGAGLAALHDQPWLGPTMAGLGAAAVGLTLANAFDLNRRNVRTAGGLAVTAVTAVAIGVFRLPLLAVLVVVVPVSLLLAARGPMR